MAKYKTEKGFAVQTLASDTAASIAATGSWASGGNLNTARSDLAGLGIETSAMAIAGYASTGTQSAVETYDGSSWTEITELNAARNSMGGFGATNTAAIGCGGRTPTVANTESWNGSAWTEVNDMNTARFSMNISGAGTQTSGLSSGGNGPAGQDTVEVWDGTNWTAAGAELNTTRSQGSASGQSSSSAAAVGGYGGSPDAPLATTELWNGSSWTEVADLNTARYSLVCTGNGTSLLVNGGEGSGTGILAITESFDGTSWTEVADLSDTIKDHGGTGYSSTNTTALSFAGKSPSSSFKNTSEEWTTASSFTKTNLGQVYFNSTSNAFKVTQQLAPTGVWSSGGNVNTARELLGGWGTDNTAAGVAGGNTAPGPSTANTELYNGSAWTEVNNLNAARAGFGATGLYSAGIAVGAYPPAEGSKVELWDGTNWTETTEINTARGFTCLSGVQTACILVGGYSSPPTQRYAICEQWDGSSWTEIADLNTGRPGAGAAAGAPVTDTVAFGGYAGSPLTQQVVTEKWNGSSWTEVGDMNNKKNVVSGHGDSGSNAGAFGGEGPGTHTELWNGSSWTEVADNANPGWRQQGGVPSLTKGILSAGGPPAYAHTEEWNALEENKTITVS